MSLSTIIIILLNYFVSIVSIVPICDLSISNLLSVNTIITSIALEVQNCRFCGIRMKCSFVMHLPLYIIVSFKLTVSFNGRKNLQEVLKLRKIKFATESMFSKMPT